MRRAALQLLQDEKLPALDDLLGGLARLDGAPDEVGVVVGVHHAHNALVVVGGHLLRLL